MIANEVCFLLTQRPLDTVVHIRNIFEIVHNVQGHASYVGNDFYGLSVNRKIDILYDLSFCEAIYRFFFL